MVSRGITALYHSLRGEFHRVVEEIKEDLFQLSRIGNYGCFLVR